MRRPTCAVVAAILILAGCSASAPRAEPVLVETDRVVDAAARARLDTTLRSFVESGRVAGVSALIHEKGEEVYFGAFGMADREGGVPMSRNTIVQIYSMTKPVTGVALMQLHEAGAFRLDDDLADHAPEFAEVRVLDGTDPSGEPRLIPPIRPISVRDLTRHTAGFATGPETPGVGRFFREADPLNLEEPLAGLAERLARVPLWSQPGERWAYGISVDVQAHLVERLSGHAFYEYIEERILQPLGMRETRYHVPQADRRRLAAMYQRSEGGGVVRVPDERGLALATRRWPMTPGGFGLTSTLDDYMRFARMLLGEGALNGVRILRPETVRLMATDHLPETVTDRSWLPGKGQVGFGIDLAVRVAPPASAEENQGAVGEFFWDGAASTLFWVDPANDLAAVFFVQVMPFDGELHRRFREAVYGPFPAVVQADARR